MVSQHKAGKATGIYSLCCANSQVIEAAMLEAKATRSSLLLEATSNQVNQFGGYTDMTPTDFREFVQAIARRCGLPLASLQLGGDHLGPNCWRNEPSISAMAKAATMVAAYVHAGFRKIHLDCSMSCADDATPLAEEEIAQRAAHLCSVAEEAHRQSGGEAPVYVIGTEVPVPGGALESLHGLAVTTPAAAQQTIAAHESAFRKQGCAEAWQRVIALVVQPGVEFDHHQVIDYQSSKAQTLSRALGAHPQFVFEAHSTDYQTPENLAALVRDHFAILKVGPGATFALRETLWALADIERELLPDAHQSQLKAVVLSAMRQNPVHWRSYYTNEASLAIDLQFSLSDRSRYYWPDARVQQACKRLLANLAGASISLTLLSQYLPIQYAAIRAGRLANDVVAILNDGVGQCLRPYIHACAQAIRA
jgi:D-tagatose-1,6-bisphosphate aldolase subunit GatZ/KbaZ